MSPQKGYKAVPQLRHKTLSYMQEEGMAPTVGLHCLLLPLPSAQSGPTSVKLSGWPLNFIPRRLRTVCMPAPPRPASAISLDCPDEGLSPNFGSLNLFPGPAPPAPSQLALPALACCVQGFQTCMVHLSFVLVESVLITERKY